MSIVAREKKFFDEMEKLYPDSLCIANPFFCIEGVGYAKCLGKVLNVPAVTVESYCEGLQRTAYAGLVECVQDDTWEEVSAELTRSIDEFMKLIDDALCHGFEFKVDNGKFYFREHV